MNNDDNTVAFAVSIIRNILNMDTETEDRYNLVVNAVGKPSITYSNWGGHGWYVVSGVKDGYVYYIKGLVGNDRHTSLCFKYPYSQKKQYDWMIPVLESNFYQD